MEVLSYLSLGVVRFFMYLKKHVILSVSEESPEDRVNAEQTLRYTQCDDTFLLLNINNQTLLSLRSG